MASSIVSQTSQESISELLSNIKGNFTELKSLLCQFDIETIANQLNIEIDTSNEEFIELTCLDGDIIEVKYCYFLPSISVTTYGNKTNLQFRIKYSTTMWNNVILKLYPDLTDKNYFYTAFNPQKHQSSDFLEAIDNAKQNFVTEMVNNIEQISDMLEDKKKMDIIKDVLQNMISDAINGSNHAYERQKDVPMDPLSDGDNLDHPFGVTDMMPFDLINWDSWKL